MKYSTQTSLSSDTDSPWSYGSTSPAAAAAAPRAAGRRGLEEFSKDPRAGSAKEFGLASLSWNRRWVSTTFVLLLVIYFALALAYMVGGSDLVPAWAPAVAALVTMAFSAFQAFRARQTGAPRTTRFLLAYTAVTLVGAAALVLLYHEKSPDNEVSEASKPWWLWLAVALPLLMSVASMIGIWKRGALGGNQAVLGGTRSPEAIDSAEPSRKDLLETVFHGFVTLLVELVALSGAFMFYLSKEAEKAVQRPVFEALYNDNRQAYVESYQDLLDSTCATASAAVVGPGVTPQQTRQVCCSSGIPERTAAATKTLLGALAADDPALNDVAVQNRWVFRLAILYVGMAVVAFFVAYVTNRLAGGPSVNIPSILRYNIFLLAIALGLQVVFMFLVTLRYVPIKPSEQWKQLRAAVNEELDRVVDPGKPRPYDEDLEVVPVPALVRNAVLVGLLILSGLAIWFAWRIKAFQTVSFAQSVVIQTLFIGIIMTSIYFTLSRSVASDAQGHAMVDIARKIAEVVRVAPDSTEEVRARVSAILDKLDAEAEDLDESVRERNAEVMAPFVRVVLIFLGVLAAALLVSARSKLLSGRFWVALLAVGLVGGATSITVEYGFLQNVFRNFRPLNTDEIISRIATNVRQGIDAQTADYCANDGLLLAANANRSTEAFEWPKIRV